MSNFVGLHEPHQNFSIWMSRLESIRERICGLLVLTVQKLFITEKKYRKQDHQFGVAEN